VLINNAGVFGPAAPIEDYPHAGWAATVETNLTGAFLCAQAAFRQMLRQRPSGGRIINNGSLSAHVPRPNAVAYTATKHGITGLTKALALEGRAHGIACGQIDIGNAATDMTKALEVGALQADGSIVAEPTISVEHVADAVLYMVELPADRPPSQDRFLPPRGEHVQLRDLPRTAERRHGTRRQSARPVRRSLATRAVARGVVSGRDDQPVRAGRPVFARRAGSGLSTQNWLTALRRIHELVQAGSQLIIATHSPIILAYPEATTYHCSERGLETVDYEDAEPVRLTRSFLEARARFLTELLRD